MSATRLTLSNFKAFGPVVQKVPLKPITLVFGPNSAGKSSILHSLLWLQHGLTTGEIDVHTTLRTKVDLGGFDQLVHGHQPGTRPVIGWSIPGSAITDGVGGWNKLDSFDLELQFHRRDGRVGLCAFAIGNPDGPLLRASVNEPDKARVDLLDAAHPAFTKLIEAWGLTPEVGARHLDEAVEAGIYQVEVRGSIPTRFKLTKEVEQRFLRDGIPTAFNSVLDAFECEVSGRIPGLLHIPPLRNLPSRGFDPTRSDEHWKKLVTDPTVLERVNRWLNLDFMGSSRYRLDLVRFIRRDAVERSLADTIRDAFVDLVATDAFGDDTVWHLERLSQRWKEADRWVYLLKCPEYQRVVIENVQRITNEEGGFEDIPEDEQWEQAESIAMQVVENEPWIFEHNTPEPHFIEFLKEDAEFMEFLSTRWNQEKSEAALRRALHVPDTEQRSELLLRDLRKGTVLALQDVGTGMSQILPVLSSAFAERNRHIAIEQPELHIHPRLQAELGDVFIESALGGNKNTFLIETHSEHLILRILRRIRETTEGETGDWPEALRQACPNGIRPEDVAVLYVEPGEDGARVIELPVTPDGDFSQPWPGGFFGERSKELF
jgi:hypothetical protein